MLQPAKMIKLNKTHKISEYCQQLKLFKLCERAYCTKCAN